MGDYLNIGNAGFAGIRNGIYVDKTEMIDFINNTLETSDRLTVVSRPRRFGKSFAAKMLCAYYDKSCDSKKLFDGLAISKCESYEKHLNKYDVIYLDITWFISSSGNIKNTVHILHEKLLRELRETYPEARKSDTLSETLSSVNALTGGKFIFIIDEWDALFREAKDDIVVQKQYMDLLRSLFKNSGFTDKMIAGAYMTGILPVKKYGNQSSVSDFREFTMLTPKRLAKYTGFTEAEVKNLCSRYDMNFTEMKRWYDGYSFFRVKSIYNPNSVMEAIKNGEYGSYWTRTETYESLKDYIDMDFDGLREAVIQMLGNEKVKVDVETFQNDMSNIRKKDDVITLLVHLGYLAYDSQEKTAYIPNEEVKKEFIRAVTGSRHQEIVKLIQLTDHLLVQTLRMDESTVAAAIEEIHKTWASPLHYNSEDALRSTIHFAYLGCMDDYNRIDELPSGHGYVDVAFQPNHGYHKPVILIELKWNKSTESAIEQIKARDYPHAFRSYEGEILLVGVNYDSETKKHTCKIEKYTK